MSLLQARFQSDWQADAPANSGFHSDHYTTWSVGQAVPPLQVQQPQQAPLLLQASGVCKSFHGVAALRDGCIALRSGSVHALCGGNGAGKSTLLSILTGLVRADGGDILRNGRAVLYETPVQAQADGIAIITQELGTVLDMTVAENIYLGREPRRRGWLLDREAMLEQATTLLERLGFSLNPSQKMRDLSLADMQLVEICKAMSRGHLQAMQGKQIAHGAQVPQAPQVLIMDEPTSALGEAECEKLFAAIAGLKRQGVGIIYVSHRLDDIFKIADSYTVMRDGCFVETGAMADISRQRLISLIVGKELNAHVRPQPVENSETLLRVHNFSRCKEFSDIDLHVNAGEIVGVYGLAGAGRSEFASALFGITKAASGMVEIAGQPVHIANPAQAIQHGLGLVPEDRKLDGLVLSSSVKDNIGLSALPQNARWGWVQGAKLLALVAQKITQFSIKTASLELPVRALSGGNQQKIVLSKCLSREPRVLVCDEPTRGIDEGAKRQIYAFLQDYVREQRGVLMISSELSEVMLNCHRVYVFKRGRIVACVPVAETSQEELTHWAA